MRVQFNDLSGGLWVSPGADKQPPNSWRRLVGVRPDSFDSIRSRWGSTLEQTENAHSIYRFNDNTVTGVGTTLKRDGTQVGTGLQGGRLAFSVMQSLDSVEDFLFFAGEQPGSLSSDPDTTHTADFTWIGESASDNKIFVQDGFSTTILDSESVQGVDTDMFGVSYDHQDNTPTVGRADDKLYRYSGNITSTIKTSLSIVAVTGSAYGCSHDNTNNDTGIADAATPRKYHLLSGQFTTTIKSSVSFNAVGNPNDLSFLNTDTLCGVNPFIGGSSQIKVVSSQFSTTIKISATSDDYTALSFNGRDWMGGHRTGTDAVFNKYSGLVTSTIRTSTIVNPSISLTGVRGMETNLFTDRFTAVTALVATLQKLSREGVVSNWGINSPTSSQALSAADSGGGAGPNGTYLYKMTYKSSNSQARSNPSVASGSVTVTDNAINVTIASVDLSTDSQVDLIEIWRTVAGGAIYFKVDEVENVAQTYLDSFADTDLQDEELPTDNTPPSSAFTTCLGPHAGRMWWSRVDTIGRGGRLFYSPIGRPESQDGGTILLADDDDQIQRMAVLGGNLYAFSVKSLWQIAGTDEPFIFRRIMGAPGTVKPFSVVTTPYGICYQAQDGIRVFDGNVSKKMGYAQLRGLFRGETIEDYEPFEAEIGCYARDEYIVSDLNRTFAFNLSQGVWRELGVVINGLYYDAETDQLLATILDGSDATVVVFEDEGVVTDNSVAIPFMVETSARKPDPAHELFVSYLYFDVDTRGEDLIPSVIIDGVREDLDSYVNSAGRGTVEIPFGRSGRSFAIRLTGDLLDEVEVFGIEAEVDGPYGVSSRR